MQLLGGQRHEHVHLLGRPFKVFNAEGVDGDGLYSESEAVIEYLDVDVKCALVDPVSLYLF